MRRFVLFSFYLLVFGLLRAQVNVGLDVGYGNKGYSYTKQGLGAYNKDLPKGQSAYLAPRVGYVWGEVVSVGVQLGAEYSSFDYADGYYDPIGLSWLQSAATNETMFTASARAYLRLRCAGSGRLSLHVEISGIYSLGWGKDTKTEYRSTDGWDVTMFSRLYERQLCAQVLPVINYAFNNHVSMDVYLNLAAVTFASTTTTQWPYVVKDMAAWGDPESVTSQQEFNAGFNSLNASLLTVGFGYTF